MRLHRLAVLAAAFGLLAAAQARAIDPCNFVVCGGVPPVATFPDPPPVAPPPLAKGPSTHLLFPFVTNQAGFDTVLTIANSSADPFGTAAPEGSTCVLYFYGAGSAPVPISVPLIAPGTTTEQLASALAPGFQGYVIADCDFPRGHGFAAVTDLGSRNLAAGYPALVIPPGKRKAGEALSQ